MSLRLGSTLHAVACQQAAAVRPQHGEHVRDTLARALGLAAPLDLRLPTPEGTVCHGGIVLCPSAGAKHKLWPAERWEALAQALKAEGRTVLLAPTESSLRALSALLAGASLVVAVDSGAAHLADALGVPVIGLYAATSSETYGPYRNRARCIDKHREASDALGLPYDSSRHLTRGLAMHRIEVFDVLQRIHAHA